MCAPTTGVGDRVRGCTGRTRGNPSEGATVDRAHDRSAGSLLGRARGWGIRRAASFNGSFTPHTDFTRFVYGCVRFLNLNKHLNTSQGTPLLCDGSYSTEALRSEESFEVVVEDSERLSAANTPLIEFKPRIIQPIGRHCCR